MVKNEKTINMSNLNLKMLFYCIDNSQKKVETKINSKLIVCYFNAE